MFVRHLNELEIQGWVRTDVDAESGGITWELERPVTEELYRWLLGYQPMLEVLEPQWLRERVADDLRSALARHGASP
jgi:predicted DNA-binding transcriptional regulator YafY